MFNAFNLGNNLLDVASSPSASYGYQVMSHPRLRYHMKVESVEYVLGGHCSKFTGAGVHGSDFLYCDKTRHFAVPV